MSSFPVHTMAAIAFQLLKRLFSTVQAAFQVLKRPIRPAPTPSWHASPTLVTLPTDVLQIVLQLLYDPYNDQRQRYDHETCKGIFLLPLSESCRYMRGQTLPWIFREVYNWDRPDGSMWPESLWPFFR